MILWSKQTSVLRLYYATKIDISRQHRCMTLMHQKDTSNLSLVSVASLKINRTEFFLSFLSRSRVWSLTLTLILLEISHFNPLADGNTHEIWGCFVSNRETNKLNKKMLTQSFFHAIINNGKLSFCSILLIYENFSLFLCCDFDRFLFLSSQKVDKSFIFMTLMSFKLKVSMVEGYEFHRINPREGIKFTVWSSTDLPGSFCNCNSFWSKSFEIQWKVNNPLFMFVEVLCTKSWLIAHWIFVGKFIRTCLIFLRLNFDFILYLNKFL